jgi:hypothetical protein
MEIGKIKAWLESSNQPYHSWNRVLIKALPEFNKENLYLHDIKDNTILSPRLFQLVRHIFATSYNIDIPEDLERELQLT